MAKMSAKKIKSAAKSKPLVQNCFIIHVLIREDMGLINPEDGWAGPTHVATPTWVLDPILHCKTPFSRTTLSPTVPLYPTKDRSIPQFRILLHNGYGV